MTDQLRKKSKNNLLFVNSAMFPKNKQYGQWEEIFDKKIFP